MSELADVLALLEAVPFRADPRSLETVLEGPRAASLLGHAAGVPLSAQSFWDKMLPDDERSRVLEMLRAVAADGMARAVEHRAVVPGRPMAWFRTAVRRTAGETGAEPALVGVMLDTTAARAIERQSQELESWLATLGESLPFDFWICDRYGRFVLQNPASRRRLGNVLGHSAMTLTLRAEAGAHWEENITRALSGERVQEEVTVGVDGEERVYSRVISPVRLGAELSGALGVDIDVTELKQAERRLRLSLEELRLAQDELIRRERLSVLGEMAAAVAHEVRNPLASMFNAIELLRRATRSEAELELLRILFEELRRLDVLVDNLFALVRPMEAVLRPQSIVSVVDEAVADALRAAPQVDRIRVVRRIEEESLQVAMDGQLVGLALVNVLRNALQAMPEGGELGVEIGKEERGGSSWARISIRDTGTGIAPDVRDRIFEPFFTTRPTGSGLGLPIVKRIIAEHRGELEVHSERGQGTAFVMRLPCQPPARRGVE